MASIKSGTYTVQETLDRAQFDLAKEAAVDYGDGVDRRKVQIGGLPFSFEDEKIHVPYTADKLEITLDGEVVRTLDIELDDDQKAARKASFESAADADEPS